MRARLHTFVMPTGRLDRVPTMQHRCVGRYRLCCFGPDSHLRMRASETRPGVPIKIKIALRPSPLPGCVLIGLGDLIEA